MLVDGSNVVLIQLNPWSKEPNEFASHVFELPPDADNCDEIDEPIVGDVMAVPECALAPVVKEHLGLKQVKPPLNIRHRIYDHALLLAQVSGRSPIRSSLSETFTRLVGGKHA